MNNVHVDTVVVSAIVERERDGEIEVLVQTRWKPGQDPAYSGTLEIPAGGARDMRTSTMPSSERSSRRRVCR
jgi:8-oxo-dGTP pyrophosphatase MutT (NUDIX family)